MNNPIVAKISLTATFRAMVVGQVIELEKSEVISRRAASTAHNLKRAGEGVWSIEDKNAQDSPTYKVTRTA